MENNTRNNKSFENEPTILTHKSADNKITLYHKDGEKIKESDLEKDVNGFLKHKYKDTYEKSRKQ